MSHTRQNWSLIAAFTLPLLLIGGLALSALWPQWQLDPQYDFVYTSCNDFDRFNEISCEAYLDDRFQVGDSGRLIDTATSTEESRTFRFFRHDTERNQSTEIAYDAVTGYELSPLLTAPDGITLESGYQSNGGFFLFGGGGEYAHYLSEGNTKVTQELINDFSRYSYRNDFYFVGWILAE